MDNFFIHCMLNSTKNKATFPTTIQQKKMEELVAVTLSQYLEMQGLIMGYLREGFDRKFELRHEAYQNAVDIIEQAERLQLPAEFIQQLKSDSQITTKSKTDNFEMVLNRFAIDLYYHLRPNKLMTTNDIADYVKNYIDTNG